MSSELIELSLYEVLLTDAVEQEEGDPDTRGVVEELLSKGVRGATS